MRFYFDNFVSCAESSCEMAHFLKEVLTNFKVEELPKNLDKIHTIEHAADEKKHQITDKLAKAFITPLEREDIVSLSHHIDEMTDKMEEVLLRIYINNVQQIRPEAISLLDIIIQCCEEVCELLKEFANFRHSKNLKERIIRINSP